MRPKKHLEYYSRLYPSAWQAVDRLRAGRGHDLPQWPDWCFLPLSGVFTIVADEAEARGVDITSNKLTLLHDIGIVGALAAWRVTQGVYRFDPDVYQAVVDTPLTGNLPHSVLLSLPEWCVYVETPDLQMHGLPVAGFFAHLEYDPRAERKELRCVLDFAIEDEGPPPLMGAVLHLGEWSLYEAVDRVFDAMREQAPQVGTEFTKPSAETVKGVQAEYSALVSLLLYICSVNSEIGDGRRRPTKPQPVKTRKGLRTFPPQKVTAWDVGVRMGAALRAAEASEGGGGTPTPRSGPRPHVRRAHWHGYWTGPRDGKQKYILKWLSPILVGAQDDDLPVTIRPVE